MARKLAKKARVQSDQKVAAQAVHDLVGGARKRPKRRKGPDAELWGREAKQRFDSGKWDGADARHLVGLFIFLYTWCYEAEPSSMKGKLLLGARSAADKMLRTEFNGDIYAAAEYVRWAFVRERERELWRREKGVPGAILNWRKVFVFGDVLEQYRVHVSREKHGG